MSDRETRARSSLLLPLVVLTWLAFLLGKLFLISHVELFQDEAFYFQESQRLSFAYSDIPFMTALLIHLGTSWLDATTAGVRVVFLAIGSLIPILMFWLAKPVVGTHRAYMAAGLSLLMPLLCSMGSIAAPDVALIAFTILAMGCFERATRTRSLRYWFLTGLFVALGLCTHYRFLPFLAAGALYLALTRNGRSCLSGPGVWIAGLVSLAGLVPLVYFNLSHEHSAVAYHFVDRHSWGFRPEGLLYAFEQALFVTPLLFVFLVAVLIRLLRQARAGDDRAALFASFAAVQAGVYFVLSPFMDQSRISFHWPLSGYLALLVFLPGYFGALMAGATTSLRKVFSRLVVGATLALGLLGTTTLLVAHGMQGFYDDESTRLNRDFVAANSNFAGWADMADRVESLLARDSGHPQSKHLREEVDFLIGEHYVVASQLEFYLGDSFPVYTVDEDKAGKDGRSLQLRLWGLDTGGVKRRIGDNALIVLLTVERDFYSPSKHAADMVRLCGLFDELERLDELSLWDGIKGYEFYLGRGVRAKTHENADCLEANAPLNGSGRRQHGLSSTDSPGAPAPDARHST